MALTAGKLRGLRRLADRNGRFKMVAIDQRPPILNVLREKLSPQAPTYEDVAPIKALLAHELAPLGSAVLIDPDYGYARAEPDLPPDRGLLITLEDCVFMEDAAGARKTSLQPDWSVEKIKRAGADGVKLLLWYRPDCPDDMRAHQKRLVLEVGAECARFDIPFLLELLVYPLKGAALHTRDYVEDKSKRPELVLQSLEDFAAPEYGVDIYKLESPIAADALPPLDDSAEANEAQAWFDKLGALIDRPWVMLSAGAGMEPYRRVLAYAYRAGANGYLAGRAIWWDAFKAYPDLETMQSLLRSDARDYMLEINTMTDQGARPWFLSKTHGGTPSLDASGFNFPIRYRDMSAA